jgi:hypothetical protein
MDLPPTQDVPKIGFADEPPSYGRTRLMVLPVDPYAVFAYWEVTPETLKEVEEQLGDMEHVRPVLRFHEHAEGPSESRSFDVEIPLQARRWRVDLWSPGKSYDVELAFKTPAQQFVSVASAGGIETPRAWPVSEVRESFMAVSGEERRAEIVAPPEIFKFPPREIQAFEVEIPPYRPASFNSPVPTHEPAADQGTVRTPSVHASSSDLTEAAEKQFVPGISSPSVL